MLLYNTLTRRKEPFVPAGDPTTIYVCGITPYDTTHLGHAFTYVFFDLLIRYLQHRGHTTRYAQNVTDLDDDILRRARELGTAPEKLAVEETRLYREDMAALNVLPPDFYPRATWEIPKMVAIIQVLLERGLAYESGGNVYYDVGRDPNYGRLSHLDRDEMLPVANERGNDGSDLRKRHPLDFVLWQKSPPNGPSWDAPWGSGMPGWHVECSAMALRYLGDTIDIHGGGEDLVFPHHESEIAQSEPYTGKRPFVRHWVHVAMVYCAGQKMSKSLGNLIMIRDLIGEFSADGIRLLLLSHHHREPWSYEREELERAEVLARELARAVGGDDAEQPVVLGQSEESAEFLAAMDDDMYTPAAIGVLERLAGEILRGTGPVASKRAELRAMAGVLGLRLPGAR